MRRNSQAQSQGWHWVFHSLWEAVSPSAWGEVFFGFEFVSVLILYWGGSLSAASWLYGLGTRRWCGQRMSSEGTEELDHLFYLHYWHYDTDDHLPCGLPAVLPETCTLWNSWDSVPEAAEFLGSRKCQLWPTGLLDAVALFFSSSSINYLLSICCIPEPFKALLGAENSWAVSLKPKESFGKKKYVKKVNK